MSRLLSASELMAAIQITRRSVTRYVEAGCPFARKGKGSRAPLQFDLDKVKAWMEETAHTGDSGAPAGLEPTSTASAKTKQATGDGKRTESLVDKRTESLVDLARRVNIKIKNLEVEKRTRIEREAAGELVPLADVRRAWGAQVEVVQARFRGLPSLIAARVVGKKYDEAHEIIAEELRSVLVSFSIEELAV